MTDKEMKAAKEKALKEFMDKQKKTDEAKANLFAILGLISLVLTIGFTIFTIVRSFTRAFSHPEFTRTQLFLESLKHPEESLFILFYIIFSVFVRLVRKY